MFEKKFLMATGERALKTFFQTLLALLGTDAVNVLNVDILAAVQVSLSAALLSVLSSFASAGVGKVGPSLVGETIEEPRTVVVEKLIEVPVPATAAKKAVAKKVPAKKTAKKPAK